MSVDVLHVVVLDGSRVLTVGDVLGQAAWTLLCIVAWWALWGRHRAAAGAPVRQPTVLEIILVIVLIGVVAVVVLAVERLVGPLR